MPNVDRYEPDPTMRVYPGEEPRPAMDVWVLPAGHPIPPGSAVMTVMSIGRQTIVVCCRPAVDDREGHDENPTTVRTYH